MCCDRKFSATYSIKDFVIKLCEWKPADWIYFPFLYCVTPIFFISPFILRLNTDLTGTPIANTINSSVLLKIAHTSCFSATLPMTCNVLLDIFGQLTSDKKISESTIERFLILIGLIIPSLIFLIFSNSTFMPFLYICLSAFNITSVGIIMAISISKSLLDKSIPPILLLVSILFLTCSYTLNIYYTIYPENNSLWISYLIFFYIGLILWIGLQVYWHLKLMTSSSRLRFSDYKTALYFGAGSFYIAGCHITAASWNQLQWVYSNELNLSLCILFQLLIIVILTVVPGRLVNRKAKKGEEMLALKRTFVRFVSHEIRSPLNVVHAGLEILKLDLEDIGEAVSNKILKLLDDIYFSSSAAIEILNDLLHYENIDVGKFKLEFKVQQLLSVFQHRLDPYIFMASKKNVIINIVDEVGVSEFVKEKIDKFREVNNDSSKTDIHPTDHLEILHLQGFNYKQLYLNLDIFRMDQIIRNLITNALKFTPAEGEIVLKFSLIKCEKTQVLEETSFGRHIGFLRTSVIDNGVGIALEDQPKAFSEFGQFNRNDLQGGGGSGLGLFISRNIADAHKGHMGFMSEGLNKGTTFYVDIPVYFDPSKEDISVFLSEKISYTYNWNESKQHVETNDKSTSLKKQKPVNSKSSKSHVDIYQVVPTTDMVTMEIVDLEMNVQPDENMNIDNSIKTSMSNQEETETKKPLIIMIVDDSEMNRKIIQRMIASIAKKELPFLHDTVILEANDGKEAVNSMRQQVIQNNAINIVFLDYIMLEQHGPETAKIMREELGYNGNALPEDIQHFKSCGANDVMTKPLSRDKLIDILNKTQEIV